MMRVFILMFVVCCQVSWAQALIDPTRPVAKGIADAVPGDVSSEGEQATNSGFPAVTLSAIIISPQIRYAIINGKTVYEGQLWRNFYLTSVEHHAIVLEGQGQRREFSLKNNINLIKDNANVF